MHCIVLLFDPVIILSSLIAENQFSIKHWLEKTYGLSSFIRGLCVGGGLKRYICVCGFNTLHQPQAAGRVQKKRSRSKKC